jgi:hypothetical protein
VQRLRRLSSAKKSSIFIVLDQRLLHERFKPPFAAHWIEQWIYFNLAKMGKPAWQFEPGASDNCVSDRNLINVAPPELSEKLVVAVCLCFATSIAGKQENVEREAA